MAYVYKMLILGILEILFVMLNVRICRILKHVFSIHRRILDLVNTSAVMLIFSCFLKIHRQLLEHNNAFAVGSSVVFYFTVCLIMLCWNK